MSHVAIEPIVPFAVSTNPNDSPLSKPIICFKCGTLGHKTNTCDRQATDAGKAALKAHREDVGRRAKFGKDKKQKRDGEGGEALTAALHDALDKASADAKTHEMISRERNQLSIQVAALEKDNMSMKKWLEDANGVFDLALRDACRGFEFSWQQLTIRDFHGLWIMAGAVVSTFIVATADSLTAPLRPRQYKIVRIAVTVYMMITACVLYFSYLMTNVLLLKQVVTAQAQYVFGRNTYVMRHVARVIRVFSLADEERRDLRPDSNSLQDVKHTDCRLAEIEYVDKLTSRRTKRVISVELFVQNTTAQNINYLDAPDVIRARVFQNVPRNMTIALNRYDVLNGRHVVNDTADAVVCFSQAIREKRRLETPSF
jgi:hypothetical protein